MNKFAFISIIVLYSFSAIFANLLKAVGIDIIGMEYLLFYVFMIVLTLLNNKLTYDRVYFLLSITITLFCIVTYFTSSYIINIFWFLVGFVLLIMQMVTFNSFYHVSLSEKRIVYLLRYIQLLNIIIILIPLINFMLNSGTIRFNDLIISKEAGINATLINFNIIITLILLKIDKKKKDVFFIIISSISVLLSILLKSIFSMIIIYLIFITVFTKKKTLTKYIKYLAIAVVFLFIVLSNPKIKGKIDFYYEFYFTNVVESNPRYAAYRAAFAIARDHFPFGSGPSTFGSFPVKVVYNDTYRDYNLHNIYGMNISSKPNFLLDTYWSSPLAELGFIGFIMFFIQFLYPLHMIRKLRYLNSPYYKPIFFYLAASTFVILFESLFLAIYSQITFILLHNAISLILINYLKSKNEPVSTTTNLLVSAP